MSTILNNFRKALDAEDFGRYEDEAQKWFRKQIASSLDPNKKIARVYTQTPIRGHMYAYVYDPKTKDKLPYYDKFPLVIILNKSGKYHWTGINLHYLPPLMRLQFLLNLQKFTTNDKYDITTRFRLKWDQLERSPRRYPGAKAAIKMYDKRHVKSRLMRINPDEWFTSMFLPFEWFRKANRYEVWKDTRIIARGINTTKKAKPVKKKSS